MENFIFCAVICKFQTRAQIKVHIVKPENQHRTLDNFRQKIELCSTKAASKVTFLSYRRLKTPKHSIDIGISYSGFSFHEHFNR